MLDPTSPSNLSDSPLPHEASSPEQHLKDNKIESFPASTLSPSISQSSLAGGCSPSLDSSSLATDTVKAVTRVILEGHESGGESVNRVTGGLEGNTLHREAYGKMKVADLRKALADRNADTKGVKAVLVQRLLGLDGEGQHSQTQESSKPAAVPAEMPIAGSCESYTQMKVADLRKALADRNADTKGVKAVLVQRLFELE